MKQLKAVFIDLDGTLIDSLPFLFQAYSDFLASFGIQGTHKEFEQLNGPSIPHVVNKLRIVHHLKIPHEDLVRSYYALLNQASSEDLPLLTGAEKAIKKMHESGLQLVIVSSAHKDYARRLLIAHGLAEYFCLIVAPELVENMAKPNPRIYQYALDQMRLHPSEVIAIEDSLNGVKASTGAGIFTLHFLGKGPVTDPLIKPVENWEKVLDYIEKDHATV